MKKLPDSIKSCCAEFEFTDREKPFYVDEREKENSNRVFLCITSYRCRLLDRDNLFPKYFIDACRYSGLIIDDTEKDAEIIIRQRQVDDKGQERTEIEIWYTDDACLKHHNPPPLFR